MSMFGTDWAMWGAQPGAQASPPPSTSRPLHRMRGVPVRPPPPPPPPPLEPPDPPQLSQGSSLTVDDAWGIFGIAKKRATREEVKKRYLAFVHENHPDRHPGNEATMTTRLMQANLALKLLEKHCKW